MEIGRFIAQASQNREISRRLVRRLVERLKMLARHPRAGEARPDLGPDIRAFVVGNYVLFYQPCADGIELLRALHASRDVNRAFGEKSS
ncbi:MAG: type II toxin-antitoxin system RelE/ParE family toxin [Planctomycetia bacterium]|nr:type II toxin-antitoxin system RelE/ParE family toxin [Planctomycetia bacterium]